MLLCARAPTQGRGDTEAWREGGRKRPAVAHLVLTEATQVQRVVGERRHQAAGAVVRDGQRVQRDAGRPVDDESGGGLLVGSAR